jgi:hypothetical protein
VQCAHYSQTKPTLPLEMQEEEAEEATPLALEEAEVVEVEVVEAAEAEVVLQAQEEDPIIMAKTNYSANTLTRSPEIDRKRESS